MLTADPEALNARAVMNGAMALEAELILAARSGLATDHLRFDKMRAGVRQSLAWLEARVGALPREPDYLAFHFIALWDHLRLYGLFDLDLDRPALRDYRAACGRWDFVEASAPPPL